MERQDARSGKLVIAVHCILNKNAWVSGLAAYPAMVDEVVDVLRERNVGFLQVPCPELTYADARRPARDRAEYEGSDYRGYCRRIAVDERFTVKEAAGTMNRFEIGCLIVTKNGKAAGIPVLSTSSSFVLGHDDADKVENIAELINELNPSVL